MTQRKLQKIVANSEINSNGNYVKSSHKQWLYDYTSTVIDARVYMFVRRWWRMCCTISEANNSTAEYNKGESKLEKLPTTV